MTARSKIKNILKMVKVASDEKTSSIFINYSKSIEDTSATTSIDRTGKTSIHNTANLDKLLLEFVDINTISYDLPDMDNTVSNFQETLENINLFKLVNEPTTTNYYNYDESKQQS